MNAITPQKPLAMTASAECRPELWRLLTDERTPFVDAVMQLAASGHRDELAAVSDRLQIHAGPCGSKAVIAALVPLVTLYGVPDKTETEWKTFWGFYAQALGQLPGEALRAGVSDYVARSDSEFFPKPGPLKALCEKHAIPIRMAASRAKRALATGEDDPEVKRVIAWRIANFHDTGEWNPQWGPKPSPKAA